MTTCRALEAEIEHARPHAAHLLQAVLKKTFVYPNVERTFEFVGGGETSSKTRAM